MPSDESRFRAAVKLAEFFLAIVLREGNARDSAGIVRDSGSYETAALIPGERLCGSSR